MKKSLLLLCAFCAAAAFAEEMLKPVVIPTISNGELVAAPHKAITRKNIVKKDGALAFNGNSCLVIQRAIPSGSFSVVADVIVDKFPAKGTSAIVCRQGFHSVLSVNERGNFCLTMWGADKKTNKVIWTQAKAQIGKKIRVAAVFTDQGNKTLMQLYVNGKLDKTFHFPAKTYPYNRMLYVGGIGISKDGSVKTPFFGKVVNFWYKAAPMTAQEIAALK